MACIIRPTAKMHDHQSNSMNATFHQQISFAAHQDLAYANPFSAAQMDCLIQAAHHHRANKAVEIGCGSGAFVLALAQQQQIHLAALDINPLSLERARQQAAQLPLLGEVSFLQTDAQSFFAAHTEPYDLIICLGASQAFGTPHQALQSLSQRLAKGGMLIFAELMWAQAPAAEFIAFLQVQESDYWQAPEADSIFRENGLQLQQSLYASAQSWQEYEAAVMAGRLRFANKLDNFEQAEQVRQMAQTWQTAYQTYGRECLGFAGYVAIKTALV